MKQAKVQEKVEYLLRKYPETRNYNANKLYKTFIKLHYPDGNFEEIYDNFSLYGMPAIETVPRARRDLVLKYPELAGDEKTEQGRWEKEEEIHLFYGRRSFKRK